MRQAVLEAEIGQQLGRPLPCLPSRQATDHLGEHHVFQRGEFRQQVVRLVDETDLLAADARAFVVGQHRSTAAIDIDLAVVGVLEQAGDVQKRRFAGPGRRHQCHRLPRPDRQLHPVEHMQIGIALPVVALDIVEGDDRLFFVGLRDLYAGLKHGVTHNAAPPPDRGALPARTDRALPAATA